MTPFSVPQLHTQSWTLVHSCHSNRVGSRFFIFPFIFCSFASHVFWCPKTQSLLSFTITKHMQQCNILKKQHNSKQHNRTSTYYKKFSEFLFKDWYHWYHLSKLMDCWQKVQLNPQKHCKRQKPVGVFTYP